MTTARSEPDWQWQPVHLLGIGLSVYTISLALYRGLSPDSAFSVVTTEGVSKWIAVGFIVAGVGIGLTSMAYVILRASLKPMCHLAAYILAFATLALFRPEETYAANIAGCLRYLAIAAVAASAWLYQLKGNGHAQP